MGFNFFSWGGSQFWADVFFYQKWRIQRNCVSKSYRLLDPWDIIRHRGSFESCRKAFVNYIDIYELPRQKGSMIIMLHSFGENKNVFKPMWRRALERGYMAAAINYPSMQSDCESHIRQLIFLLNNMEDVSEVCFVTNGTGSLLLRKLLNISAPWKKKLKIGRVVEINSWKKESKFVKWLSKFALTRWILGPMSLELNNDCIASIPDYPKGIEHGEIIKILPTTGIYKLIPLKMREKISSNDNNINAMCIEQGMGSLVKNRNTVIAAINFIQLGHF